MCNLSLNFSNVFDFRFSFESDFFSIFSLDRTKTFHPFKQQPAFLRLAAISTLCLALNSPAPGLLLSLSQHFPSDRHLSATSLRLYSNPPPLGSFLSLNLEGGQLNPPPPPGRAAPCYRSVQGGFDPNKTRRAYQGRSI